MVRLPLVLQFLTAQQRRNAEALVLFTALAVVAASGQQASSGQTPRQSQSPQTQSPQTPSVTRSLPASCPVTKRPAYAFIPPGHYPTELSKSEFWIGTDKLWTELNEAMTWEWRPHGPGHEQDLTAKIFWFRAGYDYRTEPVPKLRVTGKRLDGPAPPLQKPQGEATNAMVDSPAGAMLTGVWTPVPGCWEITGNYEGDTLSFVVWVAEPRQLAASK